MASPNGDLGLGKQTGDDAALALRRNKVLDLRVAGGSVRTIAKTLGISRATASRDIRASLDELRRDQLDKANDWRTILLERHEANYLALHAQLRAGHHGAQDRALRIMQEEARLMGCYAPELFAQTTREGDDLPTLDDLMKRYADAHRSQDDADDE